DEQPAPSRFCGPALPIGCRRLGLWLSRMASHYRMAVYSRAVTTVVMVAMEGRRLQRILCGTVLLTVRLCRGLRPQVLHPESKCALLTMSWPQIQLPQNLLD